MGTHHEFHDSSTPSGFRCRGMTAKFSRTFGGSGLPGDGCEVQQNPRRLTLPGDVSKIQQNLGGSRCRGKTACSSSTPAAYAAGEWLRSPAEPLAAPAAGGWLRGPAGPSAAHATGGRLQNSRTLGGSRRRGEDCKSQHIFSWQASQRQLPPAGARPFPQDRHLRTDATQRRHAECVCVYWLTQGLVRD